MRTLVHSLLIAAFWGSVSLHADDQNQSDLYPFVPSQSPSGLDSDPFTIEGETARLRKPAISLSKKNGIINSIESERAAIIRLYGKDHPDVKRLNAQVAEIQMIPARPSISDDVSTMSVDELRRHVRLLRKRVAVLEHALASSKGNNNESPPPQD